VNLVRIAGIRMNTAPTCSGSNLYAFPWLAAHGLQESRAFALSYGDQGQSKPIDTAVPQQYIA